MILPCLAEANLTQGDIEASDRVLQQVRNMKIYFLGICGTAMGNVARLMQSLGHEVAGSDSAVYPPMSRFLEEAGISVWNGFDCKRLVSWNPDLVVVGNAVTRGNPVVEYLLDSRKFRIVSLPEIIRENLLPNRHTLVVAGTHGKTTTASLAAFMLGEMGVDPGWMVGGLPKSLESGCALGSLEAPFVIEGDEYDSAFFDKRSKFIHYFPQTLVLNNIEFDHSDIFRDLDDVKRSFSHLLHLVPGNGQVIANGDDPNLKSLFPLEWIRLLRVGLKEDNDVRIHGFQEDPSGSRFSLSWKGFDWGEVEWGQCGLFNARNAAMAATATACALGLDSPMELPLDSLSRFEGVRRRQEVRWKCEDVILIEDFAHHPTAVAETLRSFRNRYPEARLAACFEPRSNTSATRVMQSDWEKAFLQADSLWLGPIFRKDAIAPDQQLSREGVVNAMQEAGKEGYAFDSFPQMGNALKERIHKKNTSLWVVLFFSNGSFGGLLDNWVHELEP